MSFSTWAYNVYLQKESDGIWIHAQLGKGDNKGLNDAKIKLDDHISNDDGRLSASSSGGGFSTYVKRFGLCNKHLLFAELPKSKGGYSITMLDLDGCLGNNGGNFDWSFSAWGSRPRNWDFDPNAAFNKNQSKEYTLNPSYDANKTPLDFKWE